MDGWAVQLARWYLKKRMICVAACFNDHSDRNGLQFDTIRTDSRWDRRKPYKISKNINNNIVVVVVVNNNNQWKHWKVTDKNTIKEYYENIYTDINQYYQFLLSILSILSEYYQFFSIEK